MGDDDVLNAKLTEPDLARQYRERPDRGISLFGARATQRGKPTLVDRGLITLTPPSAPGGLFTAVTTSPPQGVYRPNLGFHDDVLAERDRRFQGRGSGPRLKNLVQRTAHKAGLNPGFLGANMLAEWDAPAHWLGSKENSLFGNFATGADTFSDLIARDTRDNSFARNPDGTLKLRKDVLKAIPAARELKLDGPKGPLTRQYAPVYPRDDQRALLLAVYIKNDERHVRRILRDAGMNYDDFLPEFRYALLRLAVNPGSKGSQTIAARIRSFAKTGDPSTILVREGSQSQTQDEIARSATRVAAQSIHLSQQIFDEAP